MKLENKVVLVTGANRGIGKALVEALLKKNVQKIYAAARKIEELPNFGDNRVVPVKLDITDAAQIKNAVKQATDVQILINNAGSLAFASIIEGDEESLKRDMEVNYFGTINVTRAFIPALTKNGGGIATVSSVVGLASMAAIGGYSASKAALFSAIQAMRSELKPKNIEVFGIFPGPIDTDMARSFEMEKTSPEETAENIVDGIIAGKEDIFPDNYSKEVSKTWASNPKELERQFAS
jgi:NAD(P)-dependent dehydrogenase (short-subunit alcohol dehydrogenase family)